MCELPTSFSQSDCLVPFIAVLLRCLSCGNEQVFRRGTAVEVFLNPAARSPDHHRYGDKIPNNYANLLLLMHISRKTFD